jgi:ribosomal protein L29
VAAVTVGRPDDLEEARRLIAERATVDREKLEEAAVDLSGL